MSELRGDQGEPGLPGDEVTIKIKLILRQFLKNKSFSREMLVRLVIRALEARMATKAKM